MQQPKKFIKLIYPLYFVHICSFSYIEWLYARVVFPVFLDCDSFTCFRLIKFPSSRCITSFFSISSSVVGATTQLTGWRASGSAAQIQRAGRSLTAAVRLKLTYAVKGTTPPTSTRWRWEHVACWGRFSCISVLKFQIRQYVLQNCTAYIAFVWSETLTILPHVLM